MRPTIPVEAGSPMQLVFPFCTGIGFGYWMYRCPDFFARFFWVKGWPDYIFFRQNRDPELAPPPAFIRLFKILGLLNMAAAATIPIIYIVLTATGAIHP